MHRSAAWRNLAYATFSMALGFAAWGLIRLDQRGDDLVAVGLVHADGE